MLYALLKIVHLLSVIVWLGGMFFVLWCMHPPLATLDGPAARVRLMHAVLHRFFAVVIVAAGLVLASGAAMIVRAAGASAEAGVAFNMPLDWHAMTGLGVVMLIVFGRIRFVLFKRLWQAMSTQDWPAGVAALGQIRGWVIVNLILGVLIIVITRLGVST